MLDIDTLALTLPAGFGPRAARIGRLIGEQLAHHAPDFGPGHIDTLSLPPVRVEAGWSDQRIARHVAERLVSQIAARTGAQEGAR